MKARWERVQGRTSLSLQASALRWSLLISLGLTPVACGGSVVTAGEGAAGSTPNGNAGSASGGAGASGGAAAATSGGQSPIVEGGASPVSGGDSGTSGGTQAGSAPVGGAASGGVHSLPPVCNDPHSTDSQLVSCANGIQHRPKPAQCAPRVDNGASSDAGASGDGGDSGISGYDLYAPFGSQVACRSAGDCGAFHLGFCDSPGPFPHFCFSGCQTDSECGSGVCVCNGGSSGGRCLPATCKIDADCGPESFCAPAPGICDEGSFACLSRDEACWSNSECAAGSYCVGSEISGPRECSGAVCGRPFLVEESARLADAVSRGDWLELELRPDLAGLSALERAELASHFGQLGRMEHASIAAFARFNLQLLALGAPVDLVEGCNRALVDETRHARLCFALASQYAGMPIGPGKLDIDRSCASVALCDVAKLVLSEGCIGETVAALDAMAQAATASDPVVRAVLAGIANDERNHAELAYRFLRWALARATSDERRFLRREAELRLAAFDATATPSQRLAAREVARPLLLALFASDEQNA